LPVHVHADICPLDQEEFGRIAYEVMEQVFAVHHELGRFFDEAIYRDAVAARVEQSRTEVLVEVRFEDFRKDYCVDLLVESGALFELKAVSELGPAHRAQLLNYLLLTGLSHGKLVNFRGEVVEHEFVNSHVPLAERTMFRVTERGWQDPGSPGRSLHVWLTALLRDLGTGLDLHLYESAVSHFFGGEVAARSEIDIVDRGQSVGHQTARLACPGWAFKVTTLDDAGLPAFEDHARRFLNHTTLSGLHWININRRSVTFSTLER
jgi:GxxExxY protein